MSVTFAPTTETGPWLNMANGNASAVLDLLGLDFGDGWGELDAQDFLGRVLVATALLGITTDDEHGTPDVQDGNMIECGRRPGYLTTRLGELHSLATWAAQHGVTMGWS